MLIFSNQTGEIIRGKKVTLWGIFLYKKDEDPTKIIGQCPLIFNSYKNLYDWENSKFGNKDVLEWINKGMTIVRRPFKVIQGER